jgi:hypothetical protein
LQQQEIRLFGNASGPAAGQAGAEFLGALVDHAGEFADEAGQRRCGAAAQDGRDEALVKGDGFVGGDFPNFGDGDALVAGAVFLAEDQAGAEMADDEVGWFGGAGVGVGGLELADGQGVSSWVPAVLACSA